MLSLYRPYGISQLLVSKRRFKQCTDSCVDSIIPVGSSTIKATRISIGGTSGRGIAVNKDVTSKWKIHDSSQGVFRQRAICSYLQETVNYGKGDVDDVAIWVVRGSPYE